VYTCSYVHYCVVAQGNKTKKIILKQFDDIFQRIDLYNFANLLLKLGLVNAINLDGGGSATMVVNNTVINYPSDEW